MDKLLHLLSQNARMPEDKMAAMIGCSVDEMRAQIKAYERDGIIKGYTALIDYENVDPSKVTALIELKVTPKRDAGFDDTARKIAEYPEVDSVFLMSGSYDLMVMITGTNLREVALFVAQRLSALDGVISTATHFVLKRYKEKGVLFDHSCVDERGFVSP